MKIINENFKVEKDGLNNGIFVKYVGDKIVEGEFEFLNIENDSGILFSHRTHPWFNEGGKGNTRICEIFRLVYLGFIL